MPKKQQDKPNETVIPYEGVFCEECATRPECPEPNVAIASVTEEASDKYPLGRQFFRCDNGHEFEKAPSVQLQPPAEQLAPPADAAAVDPAALAKVVETTTTIEEVSPAGAGTVQALDKLNQPGPLPNSDYIAMLRIPEHQVSGLKAMAEMREMTFQDFLQSEWERILDNGWVGA